MPGSKRSSLLKVDSDDRIISDVLCIRCGTNLRDLQVADRCPNCRHPASDSVHGDYLIHADKPLVRGLAEAARVIEFGIIILGGLLGLALLASLISARSITHLIEPAYNLVFAGAMISPIIATIGLILLTTRHTASYYWVRFGNKRALLRFGLAFAMILAAAVASTIFFGVIALKIGTVIWFAVPLGAYFRGLERLMIRVPNKQLAAYSRMMLVGMIAFSAIAILIFFIRKLGGDDKSWADSQTAFSAINCIIGVALGVASYQLIVRIRRTLLSIAG